MAVRNFKKRFNYQVNQGTPNMLYCHYEHFTVADKKLTKLKFSSDLFKPLMYGNINVLNLETCVIMIKQIPASERTFESLLKIWTIPTPSFDILRTLWDKSNIIIENNFISHADLKRWAEGLEGVVLEHEKTAPKPEDFFYNTGQVIDGLKVSKEQARMTLVDFLTREAITVFENGDLIKSYKIAARKLHPDLNGGDATKMTELNFLWQQYKELV